MNEPIRQICAWCRATIREGVLVNGRVSHGICSACAKEMEIAPEPAPASPVDIALDFLARA